MIMAIERIFMSLQPTTLQFVSTVMFSILSLLKWLLPLCVIREKRVCVCVDVIEGFNCWSFHFFEVLLRNIYCTLNQIVRVKLMRTNYNYFWFWRKSDNEVWNCEFVTNTETIGGTTERWWWWGGQEWIIIILFRNCPSLIFFLFGGINDDNAIIVAIAIGTVAEEEEIF